MKSVRSFPLFCHMGSLTLLLLAVCLWEATVAYPQFQLRIPNGDKVPHPCEGGNWANVGHLKVMPMEDRTLNKFGEDFKRNRFTWDKTLCQMDSDGDNITNGAELGDPGCTWTPGMEWFEGTPKSHPGFNNYRAKRECSYPNFVN